MEISSESSTGLVETQLKNITFDAKSVASEDHPNRNEDSFLVGRNYFGVFDGVGSFSSSDQASTITKDYVSEHFKKVSKYIDVQEAKDVVLETLINVNHFVYTQGQESKQKLATTASIGLIVEDLNGDKTLVIGNVGDSRVYLLRDGVLEQITLDDNLNRLKNHEKKAREIQSKLNNVIDPNSELTEDEMIMFKQRNQIFQAIGFESVIKPRIHTIDLLPLDRIFVCSDGVSDNLTDNQLQTLLNENKNPSTAIQKIIDSCLVISRKDSFRSKPDDMTGLILDNLDQKPNPPKINKQFQNSQQLDKLYSHESLKIKRSNGQIDSGWSILKYSPETGLVTVIKRSDDDTIIEKVPITVIDSLNN